MRDDYERLRTYAVSPAKEPSSAIGLDLWLKKGFLSWCVTTLRKFSLPEPVPISPLKVKQPENSPGLSTLLANILIEWSERNG